MTGTGQLLFMAAMGAIVGLCFGYVWGRILRRRERETEWDDGYHHGRADERDHGDPFPAVEWNSQDVPRPVAGYLASDGRGQQAIDPGHRGGLASLAAGPPHPDWREQTAAELAPEALALTNVPELGSSRPTVSDPEGATGVSAPSGLGHPSPYAGPLTPAQRRRDKHKHRGQYAPVPGWTPDPAHVLATHWKPEGDRWMAEWRIEWQDDVAAVDEEIAAWTERARLWLAADRWDRGARRLGAVA